MVTQFGFDAARVLAWLTEARARGIGLPAVGPERFIRTLASGYEPLLHGEVRLHFNAFGGFTATAEWISRFRSGRIS